jgi:hypothetical protein
MVKNGVLPEREVLTGAGAIPLSSSAQFFGRF